MTQKTKKQLFEELMKLLHTGNEREIKNAFDIAKSNDFDLYKKLAPLEKYLGSLSIPTLRDFYSKKELFVDLGAEYSKHRRESKKMLSNIGKYTHIEKLIIRTDDLVKIPKGILKCQNLETIEVEDPGLDFSSLPAIEELPLLRSIKNRSLSIETTEQLERALSVLDLLDFESIGFHNGLKLEEYIFDKLSGVPQLKEMMVCLDSAATIPKGIGKVKSLERLDIYEMKSLKELPDDIGDLENLKILMIIKSSVNEIPDTIEKLKNLEELQVSMSDLEKLPDTIGKLQNLRSLYLSAVPIKMLPDSICELEALETLKIYSAKLESLPESIGKLSNLLELDLFHNQLTELPESIGCLNKVDRISIGMNPISQIPQSMENLSKLTRLIIDKKMLTLLPDSLQKISEYYD